MKHPTNRFERKLVNERKEKEERPRKKTKARKVWLRDKIKEQETEHELREFPGV